MNEIQKQYASAIFVKLNKFGADSGVRMTTFSVVRLARVRDYSRPPPQKRQLTKRLLCRSGGLDESAKLLA